MTDVRIGAGGNDNERKSVRPVKRSVRIAGHSTSVSLEDEFWQALRGIAREQNMSLSALLTSVDKARGGRSLASACRIYVLKFFQEKAGYGDQ